MSGVDKLIREMYGLKRWLPGMIIGNNITAKCSNTGTASKANNAILKMINQ